MNHFEESMMLGVAVQLLFDLYRGYTDLKVNLAAGLESSSCTADTEDLIPELIFARTNQEVFMESVA